VAGCGCSGGAVGRVGFVVPEVFLVGVLLGATV